MILPIVSLRFCIKGYINRIHHLFVRLPCLISMGNIALSFTSLKMQLEVE